MDRRRRAGTLAVCIGLLAAGTAQAGSPDFERQRQRLEQASDGRAEIRIDPLTGVARFVKLEPGSLELEGARPAERSREFFRRFGSLFGVARPAEELTAPREWTDRYGMTHLRQKQRHRGLLVFGGEIRTHYDGAGRLTAVNGSFLPGLFVDPTPRRTPEQAAAGAVAHVRGLSKPGDPGRLTAVEPLLMIYRRGLLRGVPGSDHLAYEVEVGNGADVREFVYVDALDGSIIDRIGGIQELLHRTIHEPALNDAVIWDEGNPFYDTGDPVNDDQVNGLVDFASHVYGLFANLSGGAHLSWDGADGIMHSVWNATAVNCPNATWNGTSTNYCDGVASDDVVAHEWGHAYTQATHGLIYQWQPGALNEAYSDMFGELIDLLNGAGTDLPATVRADGDCTLFSGGHPPVFAVTAPGAIAGNYPAAGASYNPTAPIAAAGDIELVDDGDDNDGAGSTTDGCEALGGFTPGRIALIDRGSCGFIVKTLNAQDAGAAGVIVVNSADSAFNMSGSNPGITIPSVMIGSSSGDLIKAALGVGRAVGSIGLSPATANSYRWLMGEDSFNFSEPIRDMWNPVCKGDPGKVSDYQYWCGSADSGGVHTNSGVPNHAFALLVDGGSYNGQSVAAIGMTKAAHLYWRAMSVYQTSTSKFPDHASALTQSCTDLLGIDLADLVTGDPSGEIFSAGDCDAVTAATLAVELNVEPTQCDFQPLLQPDPPPLGCNSTSYFEDFSGDPTAGWTLTNAGVFEEYSPRDWAWTADLPPGGQGGALFALDSVAIGDCSPGSDDQSGAMSAETPSILLPASGGRVAFEHYVATEALWDGGNVKISVNGGDYELVQPGDFIFNPYNDPLNLDNSNPMAGEQSFTGSDGGEVFSTWGESQIDLTAHASAGDVIRLRFDMGVDGCNGLDGWYLDSLRVCSDAVAAGEVPASGGSSLRVDAAGGGDLFLSWGASCVGSDTDYEVYEGTLGDFAGHAPDLCTTAGATSATVTPPAGGAYYLIVPRNSGWEGSYGTDSDGTERLPGASSCLTQVLAGSCP